MIKVLELIDGGSIGGGQTHILSICRSINKNEFDLTVSASSEGEFKNLILSGNFNFTDIHLPKIYRPKYLQALKDIVGLGEFKIIHSHGGVAGMYARFLKKKYGMLKVIHTIHGIHYINSKNVLRNRVSKAIEQHLLPYADRYICVSDGDLSLAVEHKLVLTKNTVVIKNGIDIGKFRHAKKEQALMNELSISEQDFIIGNVSRFDYQKNQRFIINFAPEILKRIPNAKFLFIGDGKYFEKVKSLAENLGIMNKVIFTGERKDVERFYPLIDIFVFPSLWEGLSITLIEALASGKCIMASGIPQNKELINDDVNGVLFSPEDSDGFLRKLFDIFNSTEKRELLIAQAIISSVNYSEKYMTDKIQRIYSELSGVQ